MKTALFIVARVARDAILSIPKRIAALLAAETDRAKVEILLRKEIVQALEGLAEDEIGRLFMASDRNGTKAAIAAAAESEG